MWWCPRDDVGCNFRARRRLGIPAKVNYAAKARDLERLAARARATADWVASLPPAVRDDDYVDYIRSPQWEAFADLQRLHALYRCERCGTLTFELEVHHATYERLREERPGDVLVLCRICHGDLDELRRDGAHPRFAVQVTGGARPVRVVKWLDVAAAGTADNNAGGDPAERRTP
jgi:hypothetical protein